MNQKVKTYSQHLALQVSISFSIDRIERVKPVIHKKMPSFLRNL